MFTKSSNPLRTPRNSLPPKHLTRTAASMSFVSSRIDSFCLVPPPPDGAFPFLLLSAMMSSFVWMICCVSCYGISPFSRKVSSWAQFVWLRKWFLTANLSVIFLQNHEKFKNQHLFWPIQVGPIRSGFQQQQIFPGWKSQKDFSWRGTKNDNDALLMKYQSSSPCLIDVNVPNTESIFFATLVGDSILVSRGCRTLSARA